MSTFNPDLHPRGNAQNPGQFAAKNNSAPSGVLGGGETNLRDVATMKRIRDAAKEKIPSAHTITFDQGANGLLELSEVRHDGGLREKTYGDLSPEQQDIQDLANTNGRGMQLPGLSEGLDGVSTLKLRQPLQQHRPARLQQAAERRWAEMQTAYQKARDEYQQANVKALITTVKAAEPRAEGLAFDLEESEDGDLAPVGWIDGKGSMHDFDRRVPVTLDMTESEFDKYGHHSDDFDGRAVLTFEDFDLSDLDDEDED